MPEQESWPLETHTPYLQNLHTREIHKTKGECPHAKKVHLDHRLYTMAPMANFHYCRTCFPEK